MSTLATRLKELREKRGYSLSDLGALVGVTAPTVQAIESGRTPNPSASTLIGLADELGVTPEYLLFGDSTEAEAKDLAMFKKHLRLPDADRRRVRQIVDLFAGDI